jgi:quercetin dioxygenase-like cupin family protein
MTDQTISVRLLAAGDEAADESELGGVRDRFMIDGADTDGRFALVQHLFAPKALAAPMHRHRNEDEFTYVLTGGSAR